MKKHIFSLGFYPKVDPLYLENNFYPFLKKYKEYLFDIYFTCLIPPFINDGMGSKNEFEYPFKESMRIFEIMIDIQKKFGITISATFNSIKVEPTIQNLNTFIKYLQPLYARGLRSITIPHYHWMASGKLKAKFPQLFIKNTILRNVSRAQNYVDYVNVGFDLINIDRYNLRDRDNLKRLKKAYNKYKIPMSILVNEGCRGACPAMDEHFELNCSSNIHTPYFHQELSYYTCNLWKRLNPAYRLKSAIMPPFREDFEEILEYVQILKLHGRANLSAFESSMEIIKRYANPKEDFIMPGMQKQFEFYNYDTKIIDKWKKVIKNCKFDCWDCSLCEELQNSANINKLEFVG